MIFFKNWVFNHFFSSVGWPRLQSQVLHQSRDILEVTSVWGISAIAILYSSVNCVCVWSTKKVNYAGLLCCREL